jgi:hypothetical protein
MEARMTPMMSQTRCDLALVLCEGLTYAVPHEGGILPQGLWLGTHASPAEYLDVVVTAGTILEGSTVRDGSLLACDMYGVRVFVPREALEDIT